MKDWKQKLLLATDCKGIQQKELISDYEGFKIKHEWELFLVTKTFRIDLK